jgi:predicted nucleic acid-binding protein
VGKERVFVDTGYFVALLNKRDALHAQAGGLAQVWRKADRELVTTDAVLIELANFFSRSPLRTTVANATRKIRSSEGWHVDRLTTRLMDRAEALYAQHDDKAWSLTDCLSMEAMRDRDIDEIATPDHHFTQAGFRILMKVPK